MTGEPAYIASEESITCFHLNTYPNYQLLKSEVAITLHFQLCSAHHTTLQTRNIMRSASTINPATTKYGQFLLQTYGSHYTH